MFSGLENRPEGPQSLPFHSIPFHPLRMGIFLIWSLPVHSIPFLIHSIHSGPLRELRDLMKLILVTGPRTSEDRHQVD